MTPSRVSGLLGLCARAGKLASGEAMCEKLIKSGGAHVALVDAGASDRAKKQMRDACAFAGVELFELAEGALGQAIGKPGRMAACVADVGFAKKLIQLLPQERQGTP